MNNEVNNNPNTNIDKVSNQKNENNNQQIQNNNQTDIVNNPTISNNVEQNLNIVTQANNIDNSSNINNINKTFEAASNVSTQTSTSNIESATSVNNNISNIETSTNSTINNQTPNNVSMPNNNPETKKRKKTSPIVIILIVIGALVLGYIVLTTIIMTIAGFSVKNTIDNSRLSSVSDTSKSIATTINLKISEEEIMGNLSQVYSSELQNGTGYNLDIINGEKVSTSNPAIYYISNDLNNTFILPTGKFILSNDSNLEVNPNNTINTSFFTYDDNVVNVCLVVDDKSDYYSKGAVIKQDKEITINSNINVTFEKGTMYSCSDGQNSWE